MMAASWVLALAIVTLGQSAEFHVDPVNGDDTGNGSATAPFRTIDQAKLTIRALPMPEGVEVLLHATAEFDFSSGPLTFSTDDSGLPGQEITYKSADPEDPPLLSGGVKLDASGFEVVTVGGQSFQRFDLSQAVNVSSLGGLASGALGDCANQKAAVYLDDSPLWLARYPNVNATNGLWEWNNITYPGNLSFQWEDPRYDRWVNATDLWLHGYWSYDWWVLPLRRIFTLTFQIERGWNQDVF